MTSRVAPLQILDTNGTGQRENDWWYYAKKKYPLYPGIVNFQSGEWLNEYYSHRRSQIGPLRIAVNLICWIGFRIWLKPRAVQIAKKYKLDSQWVQHAVTVGKEAFIDPNDIALFRVETADMAGTFMRRFEHAGINRMINPKNWQADCGLGNKLIFHNICLEYNFPHPPIYATSKKSQIKIYDVPANGPLIIKPTGGEGGRDVSIATFESDEQGEERYTEFADFVKQAGAGQKGSLLVQQKLEPHTALVPLSGTALLAARVTTMINELGEAEAVMAVLRFPASKDAIVDNIKSGGIMAPIDIKSGRLGRGCAGRGVREIDRHPVSGQKIEGMKVPDIDEGIAMALSLHNTAFTDYSIIGWDIALTNEGPYLLEGNGKPCGIVAQRAHNQGAGTNRYGELMAFHIRKAIAA